jgi:hypothetical protein
VLLFQIPHIIGLAMRKGNMMIRGSMPGNFALIDYVDTKTKTNGYAIWNSLYDVVYKKKTSYRTNMGFRQYNMKCYESFSPFSQTDLFTTGDILWAVQSIDREAIRYQPSLIDIRKVLKDNS